MNPIAQQSRHIDTAEVAKLIRQQLKRRWPATKFSVTIDRYSGGSSINIHYTGGPSLTDVESIASSYQGKGFDGSIDMAYYYESWLYPDGTASLAHCRGTQGSKGCVPESIEDPTMAGAELVSFGSCYVFTERHCTAGEYWRFVATFERVSGWQLRHCAYDPYTRKGESQKPRVVSTIRPLESAVNRGEEWQSVFCVVASQYPMHCFDGIDGRTIPEMDIAEIEARRAYIPDTLKPAPSFTEQWEASRKARAK